MKYFKLTFVMFVICLVMSYSSIDAGSTGIAGLEIKAYKGETSLGVYKTKTDDFTVQKYYNTGTVKLYGSGGYTNINVKICKKGGSCTAYKELSTGKTATFDQNSVILSGSYTVKYKNPKFTAYKLSHSGNWTY